RFVVIVTTTIVSFIGLTTLLGLTFGNVVYSIPEFVPAIGGSSGVMETANIARFFIRIAVITLSLSVIVGIVNLIMVNAQRIVRGRTISARVNSIVVVVMFIIGITTPSVNPDISKFLLEDVQTTLESALAALIFF